MKHDLTSKVQTRDELIFLLTEAAEIEHALTCIYLFAAMSMKRNASEGLTSDQLTAVTAWEQTILLVAREEMEHLALVNNILSAIGGAPHFRKPNFPQPAKYYPFGLTMEKFSEDVIKRFICFERPQDVSPAEAFCEEQRQLVARKYPATRVHAPENLAPFPIAYDSIGQLYAKIARSIKDFPATDAELFIGQADAQIGAMALQYLFPKSIAFMPGVFDVYMLPVTDRTSALQAIDIITEQGEGNPGDDGGAKFDDPADNLHIDEPSHYQRFRQILEELQAMQQADPDFEPARPVLSNPYLYAQTAPLGAHIVTHPTTRKVMDLFDGCYETMLLFLLRLFAHTDETTTEVDALLYTMYPLMTMAIRPLGDLLTTMPAYTDGSDTTAGPSFEYYRSIALLPYKQAAWTYLHERLMQLGERAIDLAKDDIYPERMQFIGENLQYMAVKFLAAMQ